MNLLVLAALKMAHDRNEAAARRRRRFLEDSRRKKKNAPKKSGEYSYNGYSEKEYFSLVISEDEVLTAFFKALEQKGEEIDDKDAEVIRKVIEERLASQAKKVEKIESAFEELKMSGLEISKKDMGYYYQTTVGEKVLENGKSAFGNKGEYASTKKSFELEYKGISLAREWFIGDRKKVNPFAERYDSWERNNADIDEKIAAKELEIEKQERKLKYLPFKKEERERKIKELKEEVDKLRNEKARGEELKSKRDIFAEIKPEQKDILERYYDLVDECKKDGKDLDIEIEKYKQIRENSYHYEYSREKSAKDRNKWQRALDGLIEDGEVSEELLDAIDTILSEEMIGYEKYGEGKDSYQMQREGHSKEFVNLIGWYIETRREKIALKGLERREKAYDALKEEHKKLCELAGLVDKAEEIEEGLKPKKGVDDRGEHDEEK